MTAGQRRYAEKIAIRLAVEILTGQRHHGHHSYLIAARYLGSCHGPHKRDVLTSLVRLLALQHPGRYRPTGTIRRALALTDPNTR
ncbi:hypothetical protein [Pseudonocardia asaccharolytica]|uniref:Uncharacterized protein n=1 Tax=Pseudonocardia asaccharolytica DSM 44247 = NBRC 16224 TaxID=1123024 RepID=A0A511D6N7_9PSEU|nr:hypothetical protein [Pseudonocardia asaccharolytica]GEL18618.1 hypothetical protein PA7_24550 [Pseudonocardia asaccharolytica DSM 44247 = NBRC 16224]